MSPNSIYNVIEVMAPGTHRLEDLLHPFLLKKEEAGRRGQKITVHNLHCVAWQILAKRQQMEAEQQPGYGKLHR